MCKIYVLITRDAKDIKKPRLLGLFPLGRHLGVLDAAHEDGVGKRIRRVVRRFVSPLAAHRDGDSSPVPAERQTRDTRGKTRALPQTLLLEPVPHAHKAVPAAGGKRAGDGMKRDGVYCEGFRRFFGSCLLYTSPSPRD